MKKNSWPSVSFTRAGLLVGTPLAVLLGAYTVAWAGATLKSWAAGERLTAADLNDNFAAVNAAFVDLTSNQAVAGIKTFTSSVAVTSDQDAQVVLRTFNDNPAAQSYLFLDHSRGSAAAATDVQDGDHLGRIFFRGHRGGDVRDSVLLRTTVNGTPGADTVPGELTLYTSDATGLQPRLTVRASGRVGIGTTNPQALLDVAGGIRTSYSGSTVQTLVANGMNTVTHNLNIAGSYMAFVFNGDYTANAYIAGGSMGGDGNSFNFFASGGGNSIARINWVLFLL